jgi:hypothetical protein
MRFLGLTAQKQHYKLDESEQISQAICICYFVLGLFTEVTYIFFIQFLRSFLKQSVFRFQFIYVSLCLEYWKWMTVNITSVSRIGEEGFKKSSRHIKQLTSARYDAPHEVQAAI